MTTLLRVVYISFFLVVFAGSLVRSTGSGMGCPDWPLCFGQLVPPTSEADLPDNYRVIFQKSPDRPIAPFEAHKTWIEYVNRLLGALFGFFVLLYFGGTLIKRHQKWGGRRAVFAGLLLLVTCFQGWVGSQVVATHLKPIVVSAHMLFSGVLLFFIHKLLGLQRLPQLKFLSVSAPLVWGFVLASALQVVLGLMLRHQVDEYAINLLPMPARDQWMGFLSAPLFYVHRSGSLGVLFLLGYIVWRNRSQGIKIQEALLKSDFGHISLATLALMVTGLVMVHAHFPLPSQSLHLVLCFFIVDRLFARFFQTANHT